MLYTPMLVDRLQLTYPSGLAVANILRALTDPVLLRQSVAQAGRRHRGGHRRRHRGGARSRCWAPSSCPPRRWARACSSARASASRAITGGLIGWALIPYFISIGWLKEGEPFRKITFLIALGTDHGRGLIDIALILQRGLARLRAARRAPRPPQAELEARQHFAASSLWVVVLGRGHRGDRPLGARAARSASSLFAVAAGVRLRDGERHLGRASATPTPSPRPSW